MKLSICIPTFNRPDLLNNCLNSILIAKNFLQNLGLKFVFLTTVITFKAKVS